MTNKFKDMCDALCVVIGEAVEKGDNAFAFNRVKVQVYSWALFTLISHNDFNMWLNLIRLNYRSYVENTSTKWRQTVKVAFESILEVANNL